MHADRLRHLARAHGPFASVYYDDSHNTEDAEAQLDIKRRTLRDSLAEQGAGDSLLDVFEKAMADSPPAVGRSGRALILGPEGVLIDEHLIRPPVSTVARVSELPYLVPLIEHGADSGSYVVVAVDHTGADLEVHQGDAVETMTIDGDGYPVHKAAGAETPGYGDPQPRAEEQAKRNLRAVAERVTALVEGESVDTVFVLGETRSRVDFLAELPERVSAAVVELHVGARNSGIDDGALQKAVDEELERRRLAVLGSTAARFEEGRGRDERLAVEGVSEVCAALRDGNVDTLIIGDVGDAVVLADAQFTVVAPDAATLSELGAAPEMTVRADEALPMSALAVSASVVRIDERIEPADGVAALLRYSPPGGVR